MARRQCFGLAAAQVLHLQTRQLVPFGCGRQQHLGYAVLKPNLATQCNDLFADVFNHLHQFEGANVRVSSKQNV